jgi:putative transposase
MKSGEQLPLRFERKWGGARKGAGRPRGTRRTVPHRARPVHKSRFPLHVTVRARSGLPPLRENVLAEIVQHSIGAVQRDAFRVVHFSIQTNHLHMIVEAHDELALARGMQWLNARIARTVNRTLRARGSVWRERYHARELRTPRSVRNAIVYVLMNAKKHGHRFASGIDALSSAPWFDGFAMTVKRAASESPVRAPRTWLAGIGWRKRGLIRADERPRSPE